MKTAYWMGACVMLSLNGCGKDAGKPEDMAQPPNAMASATSSAAMATSADRHMAADGTMSAPAVPSMAMKEGAHMAESMAMAPAMASVPTPTGPMGAMPSKTQAMMNNKHAQMAAPKASSKGTAGGTHM